jgi:NAD(P)-dependent dehydrogenase (short-subunit alcohol dehydrogenase family)
VRDDITSSADRATAYDVAIGKMGKIDSLLICVGVLGEIHRIASIEPNKLRNIFEVNTFGPLFMIRVPSYVALHNYLCYTSGSTFRS